MHQLGIENIDLTSEQKLINPLVSVCILAYNQEGYIKEAIHNALLQTYLPLEIVISDDCSDDRTFQVIKETVKDYDGPHSVSINRNIENLGIAKHLEKAIERCSGEWIIVCAGDDIPYIDRVQIIMSSVMHNKNIYAIGTAFEAINKDNYKLGEQYYNLNSLPEFKSHFFHGATAAYHRKCFTEFDKVSSGIMTEDVVFPFRALLLGGIIILNTVTLKYRYGDSNVSSGFYGSHDELLKKMIVIKKNYLKAYEQRIIDVDKAILNKFLKGEIICQIQKDIIEGQKELDNLMIVDSFYENSSLSNFSRLLFTKINEHIFSDIIYKCKILLHKYFKFLIIIRRKIIGKPSIGFNKNFQKAESRIIRISDYL